VGVAHKARIRCVVCRRFARLVVAGGRCESCAGVLPLDFTPPSVEDRDGLARECAERGDHEWDESGAQPCDCGRPHPFRVCVRCLEPDESGCVALAGGGAR